MLSFLIPQRCLAVIMLSVALGGQTGSPQNQRAENSPAQHPMGTRLKVKGIPNFGQVDANLYRGGLPSGSALQELRKLGINVVIDLRRGHDQIEENMVTKLGMQYISIPSRCPFPEDEPIARFLRVVEENRGKRIFVHCRLGDDRTGIAVASYRMAEQGWSAQEAAKEMRVFGFSSLHNLICPGLERYEESFPERYQKDQAFQELPSHSPRGAN
jgi:tyrosine-protein phosphatase SIW14